MAQLMPLPLTVSCFSKTQIGFAFLVPADLGSPGKRTVKWMCVCNSHTICNFLYRKTTSNQLIISIKIQDNFFYQITNAVLERRPLLVLLHPFSGLFSRTMWVSWYQKGKTSLDLHEAGDHSGISWTICKQSAPHSRQVTTPTRHRSIFTGRMLYLMPNQQCQSTESNKGH